MYIHFYNQYSDYSQQYSHMYTAWSFSTAYTQQQTNNYLQAIVLLVKRSDCLLSQYHHYYYNSSHQPLSQVYLCFSVLRSPLHNSTSGSLPVDTPNLSPLIISTAISINRVVSGDGGVSPSWSYGFPTGIGGRMVNIIAMKQIYMVNYCNSTQGNLYKRVNYCLFIMLVSYYT